MDQVTKSSYEPDRIPLSIFTPTMTPKQEWSIQSNESLFSIHMGDFCFYKSGELTNFDYTGSYISNTNNNNDNKVNLTDAETKEVNVYVEDTAPKPYNQDGFTNVAKPYQPQQIPLTPTKSHRSDASSNSAASFAFPTLQAEYKQERKKSRKVKSKSDSGKWDISRPDPKRSRWDDPKRRNGGGWLSCLSCFSVKG